MVYIFRARFEYRARLSNEHNPRIGSRFSIAQINTGHQKYHYHNHRISFHNFHHNSFIRTIPKIILFQSEYKWILNEVDSMLSAQMHSMKSDSGTL